MDSIPKPASRMKRPSPIEHPSAVFRTLNRAPVRRSVTAVTKRLSSTSNEFVPPHVSRIHKTVGTACECTMWLWIFWRAKHDWREFLGLEHPWEEHEEH